MAISIDGLPDAANMAGLVGAEFPILADPQRQVAGDYGVFNLLGDGVAAPATFIIGSDGAILWRHVAGDIADRPSATEILERLRGLRQ